MILVFALAEGVTKVWLDSHHGWLPQKKLKLAR